MEQNEIKETTFHILTTVYMLEIAIILQSQPFFFWITILFFLALFVPSAFQIT